MRWVYRLMRTQLGDEISYGLHEVFYDDTGAVTGWTERPVNVSESSHVAVLNTLAWMALAVAEPTLDAQTGAEVEQAVADGSGVANAITRMGAVLDR